MVTKWGYSSSFPAKNVLLTFKMEGNGTFLENSKYDHWILHKKLVGAEIRSSYPGVPFPLGWSLINYLSGYLKYHKYSHLITQHYFFLIPSGWISVSLSIRNACSEKELLKWLIHL